MTGLIAGATGYLQLAGSQVTASSGPADVNVFGAVGDGVTDDTAAFTSAIAALPAKGGTILLDATKRYAINLTVSKDNVTFEGQYGGGDQDVETGITAFNSANPALTIGNGTTQLHRFTLIGIRVYAKITKTKGVLVNGCAWFTAERCEFSGFIDYALRLTSTATASTYFAKFTDCTFVAVAATTGNLIDLLYGASYTTSVHITNCDINGQSIGSGGRVLSIGPLVEVWLAQCWIECANGRGVILTGAGAHMHCQGVMLDSGSPTDVLIEWPSTAIHPYAFVTGDVRIDGLGKNSAAATFDLRGVFDSAEGIYYGPTSYRPRFIGDFEQISTSATSLAGPLSAVHGGGPDLADSDYPAGSVFRSTNAAGSSNTMFVKSTDHDFERVVTGDYLAQTHSTAINSAATCSIGLEDGDFIFINGTTTITSFGTAARSGIRRLCYANGAFTITHNASVIYCLGQADITTVAGDLFEMLNIGSLWRMIDYMPFDTRMFKPSSGWSSWTGTATRTSLATGSATTLNCAEAIKALIDDLIAQKRLRT